MKFAVLRRLASSNEINCLFLRAGSCGESSALRINHFLRHSFWRGKVLHVSIRRQGNRAFHEFGPNRRRRLPSLKPQVEVVVEANPNHAKQIGCISREQTISRCPCFARCWSSKAPCPYRSASSSVNHILEQRRHHKRDAWIQHSARLRSRRLFWFSVCRQYTSDEERFGTNPVRCERRVTRRHFQRRHFIRAQRQRRSRLNVRPQAHLPHHVHHALVPDHFRYFHGCHVERMLQRVMDRHRAIEFLPVIVRCVFLSVELKRRGHIFHGGFRRHCRRYALHHIIQCRRVHKWLERGPRLPPRQRMIELALAIISAANQRANFARVRIERHQRNLHLRILLARFLPRRITLRQQLV